MANAAFPDLNLRKMASTRDALHAYAKVLGALLKAARAKRKHWWHVSLRPSLRGLTTGAVHADVDFELELDLIASRLRLHTPDNLAISEKLEGQSVADLLVMLKASLAAIGAGDPLAGQQLDATDRFDGYAAEHARAMQRVLSGVTAAMVALRAGIREETSPIQLWPHHFDLSMLWLPGRMVAGEDPQDEESADSQMNFGFTFGDENITEPYFYITAYPLPDALPAIKLPGPAKWHSDGFHGALLHYADFRGMSDPQDYLLKLWKTLLDAGRAQLK